MPNRFICDVVRIDDVKQHPNADNLEIVWVGRYQVVALKGEWAVGDIAVHVGPDSMVPLSSLAFSFLRERLDSDPLDIQYRLRTTKIRGVVSHGILVAVDYVWDGQGTDWGVGDQVHLALGVEPYVSPGERAADVTTWSRVSIGVNLRVLATELRCRLEEDAFLRSTLKSLTTLFDKLEKHLDRDSKKEGDSEFSLHD